jgi:hypothetical protein
MGARIEIIEILVPESLSFETAFEEDINGAVKAP